MKMDLHRLFGITAVVFVFALPDSADAAGSHRAQAFCNQHHVPCTLKHRCVAYLGSNATLNYYNGQYYNYVHKGNYYNYIDKGKYYVYFDKGRFFNDVKVPAY
jgi:hypothetical protein